MSKPPFDRDEQLNFMQQAKSRVDARIARWKRDDVIKDVISKPATQNAETKVVSMKTEKYRVQR